MTFQQELITIGMVVLGTMITRFLPFIAFPAGRETPPYIKYLGSVLPGAVFGMLVIYCIKNVNPFEGSRGIPELVSIALVAALHVWRRQMMLSMAAGTLCYMMLVQFIF